MTARALSPYIAVEDARAAIEWYCDTLGAQLSVEPVVMPDGRVGHAELRFGEALLMLSDAHPEIAVVAPDLDAGVPVTLHLEVDEVDQLTRRAEEAGARVDRGPEDAGPGRLSVIRDPFGHRWMLMRPTPGAD